MPWVISLAERVVADVVGTLAADWPYLLLSIVAAAAVPVYVGTERLGAWLSRRRWVAIAGAVLLATLTPFCSCGTTAIVLGMIATRAPWAPIVAFMVSSPLTSPEELFLSAGLFGWPFALLFFGGTIVLGFAAGAVTSMVEHTGWLANQARMRDRACAQRPCPTTGEAAGPADVAGTGAGAVATMAVPVTRSARAGVISRLRLARFARELATTGRRLAVYFLGYGTIGYLAIELLPAGLLTSMLGGHSAGSVVLAAALGIPVYITTEASLPMVAALVHGGLGLGPAMAFLVTGAGTSVGAITGAFVIARARVIGLVVGLLFAGALVLGWLTGAVLG
ncbi:MAG TPA: permease [Streptosporangiaceae bacterium]|nr:permease [Streptosporangiaceae bacterium]